MLPYMFPALVGMNRRFGAIKTRDTHVPRTRGDEPRDFEGFARRYKCSPHSWG